MINMNFFDTKGPLLIMFLVQCYVIQNNNFLQCAVLSQKDEVNNLTKIYFSRKTAFLESVPPMVDLHWNLSSLSKTFQGKESSRKTYKRNDPLPKNTQTRPVFNSTEQDQKELLDLFKAKILCWVLTYPENHNTKALQVRNTWGKRCDLLLFMSSESDEHLPTVVLNVTESRELLWGKTKKSLQYVYDNYHHEFDWFLKADDDTYVIVENLRKIVQHYDTSNPYYFGCIFSDSNEFQKFVFGGSGYVLSRAALYIVVNQGLRGDYPLCDQSDEGDEDFQLGKCMESLGIDAMDMRDSKNLERFLPDTPYNQLNATNSSWFWQYLHSPELVEQDIKPKNVGISDTAVSFHRMRNNHMYVLEYLLYGLRPQIFFGNSTR